MGDEYKKQFLRALEKQKKRPPPTIEEQLRQIMRMNGWTEIRKASPKDLPSMDKIEPSGPNDD